MNQLPTKFYVYVHCLKNGQVFYVGKGCGDRAWRKKNRNLLWREVVKFEHNYEVRLVAQSLDQDLALLAEAELIDKYRRINISLVNICKGGSIGPTGWIPSAETRAKLSSANSGKNNPNYGKPRSDVTKQKISQAQQGKIIPFESRRKMSMARQGIKLQAETRQKMSEAALCRPKLLCPHCKALITAAMAKRWHFDNCKGKVG